MSLEALENGEGAVHPEARVGPTKRSWFAGLRRANMTVHWADCTIRRGNIMRARTLCADDDPLTIALMRSICAAI